MRGTFGQLGVAGAAPGSPEVDEHNLAAHVVERELAAGIGDTVKRRSHLLAREVGILDEVLAGAKQMRSLLEAMVSKVLEIGPASSHAMEIS